MLSLWSTYSVRARWIYQELRSVTNSLYRSTCTYILSVEIIWLTLSILVLDKEL